LAAKKKTSRRKSPPPEDRLSVRRVENTETFELVYPRSVHQRAADMEEVRAMLEAGELDVALDELRWLVDGCRELVEAHRLLGETAMADGDWQLARGHFGYAYQLGVDALPPGGLRGQLPYARPANRDFFDSGKGLARCLAELGETKLAAEVVERLLSLDPSDPLGLKELPIKD
jgi:tetratricopeptide (TPR) repeat protein